MHKQLVFYKLTQLLTSTAHRIHFTAAKGWAVAGMRSQTRAWTCAAEPGVPHVQTGLCPLLRAIQCNGESWTPFRRAAQTAHESVQVALSRYFRLDLGMLHRLARRLHVLAIRVIGLGTHSNSVICRHTDRPHIIRRPASIAIGILPAFNFMRPLATM